MPLTPSATRSLLEQLGHRPRHALGQNFLIDGNIVRKSLELAQVAAGDTVVEVGPGLGTLTEALLAAGAELWAVELDRRLAAHLGATLGAVSGGRLHLLEADALDAPLAGLPADRAAAGYKIVANLPYAIATPWLDAVLGGPLPSRMVLMLQREAADRYTAQPGGKDFGSISIFLQAAFTAAAGHSVSASCFHPRPDVDSVLLNLVRRPDPFVFPAGVKSAIRRCFQQRRKQIGSLMRGSLLPGADAWLRRLEAEGPGPRARPEDIPVSLWMRLAAG